jgi:hypothetical protein
LLVLQHGALKRLIDTGSIDVWTPQTEPEPGLNIHHVVRRRAQGESITRAKAIHVRMTVLQELTNPEAWAAGYKSRDDFFDWWRSKFMTGPLMEEIECWCATYQREDLDIPQFMTHPIAGRRGDYTQNAGQGFDELEAVDASQWAAEEEQRRQMSAQQAKFMWRMKRRQRKAA